jgi:hypothetical protein
MKILILFLIIPLAPLAQDRPNIVLILMDDMGWNDLGAHHYPAVQHRRGAVLFTGGVDR